MEQWKKVWRDGLVSLLSTHELEALRQALARDDVRLIQNSTCTPPPSEIFHEEAVEGACALGFCGWQADGLETVGQVEGFFIRTCLAADALVVVSGAGFLNDGDLVRNVAAPAPAAGSTSPVVAR